MTELIIDWDVDFEEPAQNSAQVEFARKRSGGVGASKIHALCTNQPDYSKLPDLESAISDLVDKINNSKTGKTITAEKDLETKQRQLDAILNDRLPTGALELAETIALERLTGFCEESDVGFDSPATRWGNKYEAEAIEALKSEYHDYDFLFVNDEQKSFQLLDYPHEWATPDAVLSIAGYHIAALDAKCPFDRKVHFRNWRLIKDRESFKKLHPMYYWQGVDQMLATGLKAFWFVSYDRRYKGTKIPSLVVHKFELSQPDADFLLSRVAMFEAEVLRIMEC